MWQRFPKFVLAFIVASAVGTWYVAQLGAEDINYVSTVINPLRTYFLILAFVSIGLEFRLTKLRQEGWKPVVVFGSAAVFNLVVGLALAFWLFADFQI